MKEKRAAVRRRAHQLGQAMTEYILVIGLVVIPMIAIYNRFQGAIKAALSNFARLLSGPGV